MHTGRPRKRLGSQLVPALLILVPATSVAATTAQTGTATVETGTTTAHASEHAARDGDEIDRFMGRVLAERDAAQWRRLGDFVLRETFSFELDVPRGSRLSPFRRVREYDWYVRDGTAVRSPVRVDGVGIDDATRRGYEQSWMRDEERRRAGPGTGDDAGGAERRELVDRGDPEPRFVTDFFYFLEWTLEPGEYYFVGRETVAGREVVRIEFYPTGPFWREAGERINRGIVKTSMVTLWIDPEIHQIVKYAFENAGLDFLRFRWLLRADGLQAVMEMAPVRGVWMPARMTLSGRATTALGEYAVTLTQAFFDYRQAETGARLGDPESDR